MTDTVNVPREVFDTVLSAAAEYVVDQYGNSYGLNHPIDRERIWNIIAAAPRVEREPVGYLESAAIADLASGFASVTVTIYSKPESGCEAIHIHPAPASDELLEAAVNLRAAQRAYMEDRGNEDKGKAVGAAADRLDQAIDKHKGPRG